MITDQIKKSFQQQNGLNYKTFLLYSMFYFPAFYLFFYKFYTTSFSTLRELNFYLCLISILLILSNFLIKKNLQLFYLLLILIFSYLYVFIETTYYYLYKNSISESTIFILLETNFSEAFEFVSMYFDEHVFLNSIFLLFPLILSVYILYSFRTSEIKFWILKKNLKTENIHHLIISICIIIFLVGIIYQTKIYRSNIIYVFWKSLGKYKNENQAYQLLSKNKFGGKFSNVKSEKEVEELYVLVIGESTAKYHMGIYDYNRNTTPLLSSRKQELKIYTDIISPHTHTIPSLKKVLTVANYEDSDRAKDGSLLQLMNRAGFTTYWISNQNPIGADETLITTLANAASKTYFTNTSDWKSKTPYDEKVLIPLQHVLSDNTLKKFIVIHLMGTHGRYYKRYPINFNYFKTEPVTNFKHEKAFQIINEYDNANLYNDYILDHIIRLIENQNKKSWVIYFSDHGEDVYQTIDLASHLESNGTKPMYDIPFFIWLSDRYKQQDKNHYYITDRKYLIDDLIYTISDMSFVKFSEFDSTRSLVNDKFKEKKRIIGNNLDYDLKFIKN